MRPFHINPIPNTMKNTMQNPLQRFMLRHKITGAEMSQRANIERTRLHRLTHCNDFTERCTVGEFKRIYSAYPQHPFDVF